MPARTSSFYFKGKSEDIPTIAKRLMVAHVLEGSVRKSGDRLRVTAQLARADNGYHLWSETYDRRLDDVFKLQDDIAAAVVKALKVKLLGAAVPHHAPTSNSEAYTLYLQAESLAKHDNPEDSLRAHEISTRRCAWIRDLRWHGRLWRSCTRMTASPGPRYSRSTSAAMRMPILQPGIFCLEQTNWRLQHMMRARALELDADDANIHRAMARVLWWFDFNWDAADAELKKARALDPGSARIAEQSALLAVTTGRLTEALEYANAAVALDPLGTVYAQIALAYHRLGALDQAAGACRHMIALHPKKPGFRSRYGHVLLSQSRPEAALAEFEQDEPWYRSAGISLALNALGRRSDADRALAIAERDWGNGMAYQISYVYAARGEVDEAMSWLSMRTGAARCGAVEHHARSDAEGLKR